MKENEQNIKREWSRNNLSEGEKLKKNWFGKQTTKPLMHFDKQN